MLVRNDHVRRGRRLARPRPATQRRGRDRRARRSRRSTRRVGTGASTRSSAASCAVRCARPRGLDRTSGSRSASSPMSSPAARACCSPTAVKGTSVVPVCRPLVAHSVSPCRRSTTRPVVPGLEIVIPAMMPCVRDAGASDSVSTRPHSRSPGSDVLCTQGSQV